jgi:hypothetical protein
LAGLPFCATGGCEAAGGVAGLFGIGAMFGA